MNQVSSYLCPVHVAATAAFLVLGGAAAALNHTRLDVRLPLRYQYPFRTYPLPPYVTQF